MASLSLSLSLSLPLLPLFVDSMVVSVRGSFVVVGVESGPVNYLSLLNCLDIHHWKGRETTSCAKLYNIRLFN